MKKIIILMPVFNDWDSLIKLLGEINLIIQKFRNFSFECIVINDSSTLKTPSIKKPNIFKSLTLINMRENRGHARCIASGLRYINSKKEYDYVIVMDSDGEDRPDEIEDLVNKIIENPEITVVAKRIKRSEGLFFQFLYQIHKLLTFLFTGRNINFGNYSCIIKDDLIKISDQESLWNSFSGTLKKNINNLNEIDSSRGLRYFGPSKMSLINLILHSFSIISVFKNAVFFRSAILLVFLTFLERAIGNISYIFIILIVIFNLIIFLISLRENKTSLLNSEKNITNIEELMH